MGMDFSALIKYRGPDSCRNAIARLERQSPPELKNVRKIWKESGAYERNKEEAAWVTLFSRMEEMPEPPKLPSLAAALFTPENFIITFGEDAFCVKHLLRWHFFLTEAKWQSAMVKACIALSHELGGAEGVVTRDESPIILAFFEGFDYAKCVKAGMVVEKEVSDIASMYFEVDDQGTWDSSGYWKLPISL